MTDWNPYQHHRGPFRLTVCRPRKVRGSKYPFVFENLPGTFEPEDIPSEAKAFLDDPRDSIIAVYVWSEPEQQHVTTYRKPEAGS